MFMDAASGIIEQRKRNMRKDFDSKDPRTMLIKHLAKDPKLCDSN
jgi:hypothetical protein